MSNPRIIDQDSADRLLAFVWNSTTDPDEQADLLFGNTPKKMTERELERLEHTIGEKLTPEFKLAKVLGKPLKEPNPEDQPPTETEATQPTFSRFNLGGQKFMIDAKGDLCPLFPLTAEPSSAMKSAEHLVQLDNGSWFQIPTKDNLPKDFAKDVNAIFDKIAVDKNHRVEGSPALSKNQDNKTGKSESNEKSELAWLDDLDGAATDLGDYVADLDEDLKKKLLRQIADRDEPSAGILSAVKLRLKELFDVCRDSSDKEALNHFGLHLRDRMSSTRLQGPRKTAFLREIIYRFVEETGVFFNQAFIDQLEGWPHRLDAKKFCEWLN